MDTLSNGLVELGTTDVRLRGRRPRPAPDLELLDVTPPPRPRDAEWLRRCAWELGEERAADAYRPAANHAGLAMVTPTQGFAHWHIRQEWVDDLARQKGGAWHHCRLVLRLYDVSYIEFNGLNAHRVQDETLPALAGQAFFRLPGPGTWQIAEPGFLLRNGEFIAAARSQAVAFARESASPRHDPSALLVRPHRRHIEVGNVWDQERVLRECNKPRLRQPLRVAAFAYCAEALGHDGLLARFVSELAAGTAAAGHEVHVFLPAAEEFTAARRVADVQYHPLDVTGAAKTPVERAELFRLAALDRLSDFPPFDLLHLHEWMTALPPRRGPQPTVLSLGSLETTRRNGAPPDDLASAITEAERRAADAADCVLTPHWLRDRAAAELGVDGGRVHAFPMEGRLPNEWEAPLDVGQVKKEIGLGPLDRVILFVGPLEHAAGVDLLVEALPTAMRRVPNLRVVFVGGGPMHGGLEHRAHQAGVGGAVRLLGHVEGSRLTRLMRAAEALVLPSRCRVPFDDAVVDLARRAGRPVVTTQGGPAHLVRHEENGLVTYDNPGSMVWALDRLLGDPAHAERMGQQGRRSDAAAVVWGEVARHYLELCTALFPELHQRRWD